MLLHLVEDVTLYHGQRVLKFTGNKLILLSTIMYINNTGRFPESYLKHNAWKYMYSPLTLYLYLYHLLTVLLFVVVQWV